MEQTKDFDNLLSKHVGQFGKYQFLIFFPISAVIMVVSFNNIVHVFVGATPKFACVRNTTFHDENIVDRNTSLYSDPEKHSKWISKLFWTADPEVCDPEIDWNNNGSSEGSCSDYGYCQDWCYDDSQFYSTIVTEWDLVCDSAWLSALSASLFMAGSMIGGFVFGALSDSKGRRFGLLISCLSTVVLGTLTAFSSNYYIYTAMRFLSGACCNGLFNGVYIIGTEVIGPRWRPLSAVGIMTSYATGIMVMGGLGFLVRDWRILMLIIHAPFIVSMAFYWFVPESVQWLLSNGKHHLAAQQVRRMSRVNNANLPHDYLEYLQLCTEEVKKIEEPTSSFTLFRIPTLRLRTLILFFLWFAISVTYYGLSLYAADIGGNDYIAVFFSGLVEIPALFIAFFALKRIGRRVALSASMNLAAIAMLSTWLLREDHDIARVVLSLVGKMCISVTFIVIYPFSVEIYPTSIRNTGLGVSSAGGKIGGFVAPFINLTGQVLQIFPLMIFGILACLCGILVFALPETLGRPLPDTVDDALKMTVSLNCFKCKSKSTRQQKAIYSSVPNIEKT